MQNQKVQIGIIAVAVLIGLIALFTQILGSGSSGGDPYAGGGPMNPYGMPGGYGPPGAPNGPGAPPGAPSYGPPGGPAGMPGMPGMYGAPGGDPYGGTGTQTAAATTEEKKAGPKPPRDGDPFGATTPAAARAVEAAATSSTEPLPLQLAAGPTPPLYEAFRWEKAAAETVTGTAPESPDIPMRMAGVLWGPRVYGLLEVNGQVDSYTPGDTVATIYRVERIERDRMILSKRLSDGKRKQVEVPLAGSPYAQGQYDTTGGAGGYPGGYGAPGGYPGAPGGPGGPPGYGGPGYGPPGVSGP
jgi:translation initiation factor IF-2